jgi:hypothetical protein
VVGGLLLPVGWLVSRFRSRKGNVSTAAG